MSFSSDAFKRAAECRSSRHPTTRSSVRALESIVAVSVLALAGVAAAGDMSGVVQEVHLGPVYGTKVFLEVIGTATGQPACQTDAGYQFVFDVNDPTGRALLATALAAQVSGQHVKVNGNNQCTLFGTVEDLRWISLGG